MALRRSLAEQIVEWVGVDSLSLVDAGTGWPSHFRAKSTTDWLKVAAYIGPIGHSQRGRGDVERRFQNPGSDRPIVRIGGELLLLIGLYESDDTRLLVGMEVAKRLDKSTRQSLFMPLHLLRSASHRGWAEHFSDVGERLIAFRPQLLPIYVELRRSDIEVAAQQVEQLVFASGAADPESGQDSIDRAIETVKRLVRAANFSRDVRDAYGGNCSMCGLDFTLVEGAHIYPVGAPESCDEVWNGIALCRNHHAAFDSYYLYIDPVSMQIRLHPELISRSQINTGGKAFVDSTFPSAVLPKAAAARPRREMFERRYHFFKSKYDWL